VFSSFHQFYRRNVEETVTLTSSQVNRNETKLNSANQIQQLSHFEYVKPIKGLLLSEKSKDGDGQLLDGVGDSSPMILCSENQSSIKSVESNSSILTQQRLIRKLPPEHLNDRVFLKKVSLEQMISTHSTKEARRNKESSKDRRKKTSGPHHNKTSKKNHKGRKKKLDSARNPMDFDASSNTSSGGSVRNPMVLKMSHGRMFFSL